jgi:hypothetical protein
MVLCNFFKENKLEITVQLGLMLSLQDGVLVTVSTMVNGMQKCKHTPHLCLILRPERHGLIFTSVACCLA